MNIVNVGLIISVLGAGSVSKGQGRLQDWQFNDVQGTALNVANNAEDDSSCFLSDLAYGVVDGCGNLRLSGGVASELSSVDLSGMNTGTVFLRVDVSGWKLTGSNIEEKAVISLVNGTDNVRLELKRKAVNSVQLLGLAAGTGSESLYTTAFFTAEQTNMISAVLQVDLDNGCYCVMTLTDGEWSCSSWKNLASTLTAFGVLRLQKFGDFSDPDEFIAIDRILLGASLDSVIPPSNERAYPDDAHVIDITKAPYYAVGDGVSDDTAAINAALRDWNHGADGRLSGSDTIYFPKGTYLVSDTLVPRDPTNSSLEQCSVRMLGEDRDKTIIKLKDKADGYGDISSPKYVLKTGDCPAMNGESLGLPNAAFGNYIQNLTVNVGSGNPGAIGIRYDVANWGTLEHVNVISPTGVGYSGLRFQSNCGPGYVKDVTVSGFNYGVYFDQTALNNIVFEHITLTGQSVCGIKNQGKNIQVRGLVSSNNVPGIISKNPWAATVLLDSVFYSPDGCSSAAVDLQDDGFLFARNVTVEGYDRSVAVASNSTQTDVFGDFGLNGWVSHDNGYTRGSITYTFDGTNVYAPQSRGAESVTVSDIEYVQGTVFSGAGDSSVAYESNVPTNNLFALSSLDIGGTVSAFTTTASRFAFDLSVNEGSSINFADTSLDLDLIGIRRADQVVSYTVTAVLAYQINDDEWVYLYDDRKQVTVNGSDPLVNQVLYSDLTDSPVGGYITGSANMDRTAVCWDLNGLGTVSAGDQVHFALFVFDGRNNNAVWWAGVDNLTISGILHPLTLNLPVKESPEYNNSDFSLWANVEHYGAIPDDDLDDSAGIQAAIDSGKEIVYLPTGVYSISNSIAVRGKVKKIDGLFSEIDPIVSNLQIVINNVVGNEFILENLSCEGIDIVHNSTNSLVIRHKPMGGEISCGPNASGDLFVEDTGPRAFVNVSNGISGWIRQLDRETQGLKNSGSILWLFGDNIESMATFGKQPVHTSNDGMTELLGGALDPLWSDYCSSTTAMMEGESGSKISAMYAGEVWTENDIQGQWGRHVVDIQATNTVVLDDDDAVWVQKTTNGTYRFFLPPYRTAE